MRLAAQPTVPLVDALAVAHRQSYRLDCWVDRTCIGQCDIHIKIDIGQQVSLADDHEVGGLEHVRVFKRLVLSLGYRENDDLCMLAEVEQRGAHKIADIFYQHHRAARWPQLLESLRDHVSLKVASGSSVDLNRRCPRGPNPFAVVSGGLIAFDNEDRDFVLEVLNCPFQQRRLAGTRRADDVQCQDFPPLEPASVAHGELVVLGKQVGLKLDDRRPAPIRMMVLMVIMIVIMMMLAITLMVMGMVMAVRMIMSVGVAMIVVVVVVMISVPMVVRMPLPMAVGMQMAMIMLMIIVMVFRVLAISQRPDKARL